MSRLASKAMQKIQRMDPTILQNNLENSQLTFEKLKSSYRWFQTLRAVIEKRKDENLESEVPHSSDLENLSKMVQVCDQIQRTHKIRASHHVQKRRQITPGASLAANLEVPFGRPAHAGLNPLFSSS